MTQGNLTIAASELKKALSTVGSTISTNAVLETIRCVMIEVNGSTKEVLFTGTNLDITLTVNAPAIEGNDFSMLIDHYQLNELAKVLPNANVYMTYELKDKALKIECDGSIHRLGGMPETDFPKSPEPHPDRKSIKMPIRALDKLKIATAFCSKDTLRPAMTGVLIELKNDTVRFVSTDAHRLYESEPLPLEAGSVNGDVPWMVLPKSAADKLAALNIKEDLFFEFTPSHARFQAGNFEMSVRLIDARFPDYPAVKPDNGFFFATEGNTLRSTLRLVQVSANKTTNQVVFDLKGNTCTLSSQDIDLNTEGRKDLGITLKGDDMKFAVNGSIFGEMLERVAGEPTIKYSTPTRALVVEGSDNKDYFLIMPLMVGV